MRRHSFLPLVLCLPAWVVCTELARAGDAPPDPDAVARDAFEHAKDPAALTALAKRDAPDPWLVADALAAKGSFDAADAFAKAAPRKEVEALPAYLASVRAHPVPPARREELARGLQALSEGTHAKAQALAAATDVAAGDLVAARVLYLRGKAAQELRQYPESSAAFEEAAQVASKIGWLAGAASALEQGARSRSRRADFVGGEALAKKWLEVEEGLACEQGIARASWLRGVMLGYTAKYDEARALFARALPLAEKANDFECQAAILNSQAFLESVAGRQKEALALIEEGLARHAKTGGHAATARFESEPRMLVQLSSTLYQQGATSAYRMGDRAKADAMLEKGREAAEKGGNPALAGQTLVSRGQYRMNDGDSLGAVEAFEAALVLYRKATERAGEASTLRRLGSARAALGDHAAAVVALRRALEIQTEIGDRREAAFTRRALSVSLADDGELPAAREQATLALEAAKTLQDPELEASAWRRVGVFAMRAGAFGEALTALEKSAALFRKIGKPEPAADAEIDIGRVYERIGEGAKAREAFERSKATAEAGNAKAAGGRALLSLGVSWQNAGEAEKAQALLEDALARLGEAGDTTHVPLAQRSLGLLRLGSGKVDEAIELLRKAMTAHQSLRAPQAVSIDRLNLASALRQKGQVAEASEMLEGAVADADKAGDLDAACRARWGLAALRMDAGRYAEAVTLTKAAATSLDVVGRDLAEGEGALARSEFAPLNHVGASSAMALGDLDSLFFFLESDRARTVLQDLGGRDAFRTIAVPAELRKEEGEARGTEAVARARLARVITTGERAPILAARKELDASREKVRDVIARIQRSVRTRADVVYPASPTLAQVKASLKPDEAMVLYAFLENEVIAFVIEPSGARPVRLGKVADVQKACEDLLSDDEPHVVADAAPAAAKALVEPLKLGAQVHRILASPSGPVSRVPLALLAPGIDIAMVPSPSVYANLVSTPAGRGDGVLALGDPDYSIKGMDLPGGAGASVGHARSGFMLVPLPATRKEAEAIGSAVNSSVLLGDKASETGFRAAVASARRWRAVHIACHGIIDPGQALLSGLALGADDRNDGFLTVSDVSDMSIPADLIALSACDTARGQVVAGEGVMGFVRAFLFAGPPRVLTSLWKVDDEATSVLMTTFYSLWNPKDPSKALTPAAALRKAQEAVRADPRWKDPEFWAAWQLWGLPD